MGKKVAIGTMNRRIVIEQLSTTADGQGGTSETWTTFATVWAKIEARSRFQRFFSDQIQPVGDHKITIRWLDGLNEKMRIRETISSYLVRLYQIQGIDWTDEKRFQLVLDAKENVGS